MNLSHIIVIINLYKHTYTHFHSNLTSEYSVLAPDILRYKNQHKCNIMKHLLHQRIRCCAGAEAISLALPCPNIWPGSHTHYGKILNCSCYKLKQYNNCSHISVSSFSVFYFQSKYCPGTWSAAVGTN